MKKTEDISVLSFSGLRRLLRGIGFDQPYFTVVIIIGLTLSAVVVPFPMIAAALTFLFTAYAVVGNDSVQTLGTCIASNKHIDWWKLWAWFGAIAAATLIYGWVQYGGDISYGRLASKGFEVAPTEFTFLQLVAPLVLIVITRAKMPVSTTFLMLSVYASSFSGIQAVLVKSLTGYGIAFVAGAIVWFILTSTLEKWYAKSEPKKFWRVAQWVTTGMLWATWLMQDGANFAVMLPRQLSPMAFIGVLVVMVGGLGIIFKLRGDRIQEIVDGKDSIADVRSATLVDFVYFLILIYFKQINSIPMSTTWVFLGLLAGRELAIRLRSRGQEHNAKSVWVGVKMMFSDFGRAGAGLAISLALAIAANEAVRNSIFEKF